MWACVSNPYVLLNASNLSSSLFIDNYILNVLEK